MVEHIDCRPGSSKKNQSERYGDLTTSKHFQWIAYRSGPIAIQELVFDMALAMTKNFPLRKQNLSSDAPPDYTYFRFPPGLINNEYTSDLEKRWDNKQRENGKNTLYATVLFSQCIR